MKMRCPKCRSTSFLLTERFAEEQTRSVDDGEVSKEYDRWPGELLSTYCNCKSCGHEWTPRRATLDAAGI